LCIIYQFNASSSDSEMKSPSSTFAVIPEYFPSKILVSRIMTTNSWGLSLKTPYQRQTFQNRTRIRLPDGCHWLSVPVKKKERGTFLHEIEIDYTYPWVQDHLKGLRYNYATTPYYDHYAPSIAALLRRDYTYLHELTSETTKWMVSALGIKTLFGPSELDSSALSQGPFPHKQPTIQFPAYRQNFPGYEPEAGSLDLLLNHGPASLQYLIPLND